MEVAAYINLDNRDSSQIHSKGGAISSNWLDEDGKEIDLTPEMTSSWNPGVWNGYIEYLDRKESRIRETLMETGDLEKISHKAYQEKLSDYIGSADYVHMNGFVDILLEGLTDIQRKVILLRYGEGWSLKKTAEHFGISIRTVRTHQQRSEQTIKDNMRALTAKGGSLKKNRSKKPLSRVG